VYFDVIILLYLQTGIHLNNHSFPGIQFVTGHKQSYSALSDSGCMIPIIKQSVFEDELKFDASVNYLGPIKLRSVFGQSVRADLVRLDARLDNLDNRSPESPFLPVTFAVVEQSTEDIILPEATARELSEYSKMCEINTVNVDMASDDNVGDKHLDPGSNVEDSHDKTSEQAGSEPTDNADNQNNTINDDVETVPFAVTNQSKLTELISEQQNDPSLDNCMRQAKIGKGNYFFKSGVLFHREKISDQWVEQLMLPQTRRKKVMRYAHRTLTGGHCTAQRTRARIRLHFNWPGLRKTFRTLFLDARDCSLHTGLRKSDNVLLRVVFLETMVIQMKTRL